MRLVLLMLFGGFMIGSYGWGELKLANRSGSTPTAVQVVDLENKGPDKLFCTLGEHFPIAEELIYSHDQDHPDRVNYCFYPIVSKEQAHEVVQKLKAAHGGDIDKVTNAEFYKALKIRVLVKTTRYHTVAELKRAIEGDQIATSNVTGMIVNDVSSLDGQEKALLRKSFPSYSETDTLIFEQGRTPTSPFLAFGIIGAGVVVGLLGLLFGLKMLTGR